MLKIAKAVKGLLRKAPLAPTVEISRDNLFQACRSILHVNHLGREPATHLFKVAVGQSKLPNAGYGLLVVEGRVKKGDIVALYSGPYYPPPPVWSVASLDGEPALKPFHIKNAITRPESAEAREREAAYQIHCDNEGGFIDGIQYTPYAEAEMKVKPVPPRTAQPYTSAQLINHPGPGIKPNVAMYDFSWADYLKYVKSVDSSADLVVESERISRVNKIGEGVWYFDPTTNKLVHLSPNCTNAVGLATIAQTDIETGEEVYLDYKYHKDDQPTWYTPVKYD